MSAIRGGGFAGRFTNRNDLPGSKSKKSKWESIVKTTDDLEREEEEKKIQELNEMNANIEGL